MSLNQRVSTYVIAYITLFSPTFLSSKLSVQVADGINYQASKLKLQRFVKLIKGQPFKFDIQLYTDKRGARAYNIKLSKQRAMSVIKYLVSIELKSENLIANYYGELNPVVDCEKKICNNADHALNKRTCVKLIKIE
jgi:outer membrane protein OmpA-like peptidoglycan-associated protein